MSLKEILADEGDLRDCSVDEKDVVKDAHVDRAQEETDYIRWHGIAIEADNLNVSMVSTQKLQQKCQQHREQKPLDIHEPKCSTHLAEIILEIALTLIFDDVWYSTQTKHDGGVDPERPITT